MIGRKRRRNPVDQDYPLTVSAKDLAPRLGISLRHCRRLDRMGRLPRPVRLGKSVRWSLDEVMEWISAGCPDRQRWESMKRKQQ